MGTNVDLTKLVDVILSNPGFLDSKVVKDNLNENERANKLFTFVSGASDGDMLVFKDNTGDTYSIAKSEATKILTDAQFNELMGLNEKTDAKDAGAVTLSKVADVDVAKETKAAEKTGEVKETTGVAATGSSAEIEKEIEALQAQKDANNEAMVSLQKQIEVLRQKVESTIKEAIAAMEDATEEQQKEADKIVQEKLKEFQSDKASGKDVKPEDLANSVGSAIAAAGMPIGFSTAVSKMMMADVNMSLMNNLLDQLSTKIQLDKDLGKQIDAKDEALEAAKEAEEAAKKSCDPIGFQMDWDLDGDGTAGKVQFDFFYDENDDGKINSMSDFVGATSNKNGDGWDEMQNLDAVSGNKDGTIDGSELKSANIKVMVTDENGKQQAMDIDKFEKTFGKIEIGAEDFEKNDEGFTSGVGPKNFKADGGNELLSSFNLKVGGKDLSGYQTNDTEDWLVNNYSSVMDIKSLEKEGVDVSNVAAAAGETGEVTEFEKFVTEYRETVMPQLEQELKDAYTQLGFSKDLVSSIKKLATATAETESEKISKEIEEKQEEAKAEEEKKNIGKKGKDDTTSDIGKKGKNDTTPINTMPENNLATTELNVVTADIKGVEDPNLLLDPEQAREI